MKPETYGLYTMSGGKMSRLAMTDVLLSCMDSPMDPVECKELTSAELVGGTYSDIILTVCIPSEAAKCLMVFDPSKTVAVAASRICQR